MANETTTANVGSTIPTIVDEQIILVLRETNIVLPFTYMEDAIGMPGASTQIPRLSVTLTPTAITTGSAESAAQANTQMTTDSVTLTSAAKAIHVDMGQFAKAVSSQRDWDMILGAEIGKALAAKMDQDAAAVASGFSNTVGVTTQEFTVDRLVSSLVTFAQVALEEATFGIGLIPMIMYSQVLKQLSSGVGAALAVQFVRDDVVSWFGLTPGTGIMNNRVGSFMGTPFFRSENLPTANAGADKVGCIMVRNRDPKLADCAIGGRITWLPEVRKYDAGVNNRLADVHQGRVAHGFGELKDDKGVTMIGKAT